MATTLKNLSDYEPNSVPSGEGKKIGIVVSEWNYNITQSLLEGAVHTLEKFGVASDDILIEYVPGSFELTYGAKLLIERANVNAVIILGCVIQGETPHFSFVCNGVTNGTTELNLRYNIPVIFGVLTTDNLQQAEARSGGRHGNKGDEAAITALKMIEFDAKYR